MKNSKLRRILLTLACAVLLVSLSVGATLAYLTSTTEIVQNTFTVGKVKITLDEGKVHPAGERDDNGAFIGGTFIDNGATRVQENQYKVYPGMEYDKDPTVHVQALSENCYVRAIVTVTYQIAADTVVSTEWIENRNANWTWTLTDTVKFDSDDEDTVEDMVTRTYEVRYNTVVPYSAAQQDLVLFTGINIPETLNNDQLATLEGFNIHIIAHAIQEEGFADDDAAWAAFDVQHPGA